MAKKERIATDASKKGALSSNPFGGMDFSGLELAEGQAAVPDAGVGEPEAAGGLKKGRVDLRREKAGRGGKTVTVLEGIDDIKEQRELLKMLQKHCGSGGTIKGKLIEVQGDKREQIAECLKGEGYRVVLSGG